MLNPEEIYIDFASKISFLEFIQDEFRPANIAVKDLQKEIDVLLNKKHWNINELSDFIKNNPKSFIIFEAIFQLLRFTNAQLVHFVFDVTKLNSINIESIYEYMILNLKHDNEFRKRYLNLLKPKLSYEELIERVDGLDKKYLIATFKIAVSEYIGKISKNFNALEKRIAKSEFEDFSIRFSNYLLNNLKLNEKLATINVEKFLQNKRIPIDTKSLHGNYTKIKVTKILEKNGYVNIDSLPNKKDIKILNHDVGNQLPSQSGMKFYCMEKDVEGVIKPKDNKPKKFDLIIFSNNKPKYLFELNFYSTEGTKIGINQNEYIDLNSFIKENFSQFKFFWITDGNYWLTSVGKARFLNMLNYFDEILNINIFNERIDSFS